MKLVFLVKYYENYQSHLLEGIQRKDEKSYDYLIDYVNKDKFLMYNSFVSHLRMKGHEVQLIVPNCEWLQKKWASENNIEFNSGWKTEIALQQLEQFKPDIFFVNSNFEYWGDFCSKAKQFCKKICSWLSCPYPDSLSFNEIDAVFTLFPPHFEALKSRGIKVVQVQAGFDPLINKLFDKTERTVDVSFVGGVGGHHHKRAKYLKYLVKRTPLELWGYGYFSDNPIKSIVKQFKDGFTYNRRYNGIAWGLDMFEVLAKSKISLNVHGDIAGDLSVNMRMFETTGMGSLLLTESGQNISQYFVPGKEIICYDNMADAEEKINYYLNHEKERRMIAQAGQKRTLIDHNYSKILDIYIDSFNELLQ